MGDGNGFCVFWWVYYVWLGVVGLISFLWFGWLRNNIRFGWSILRMFFGNLVFICFLVVFFGFMLLVSWVDNFCLIVLKLFGV